MFQAPENTKPNLRQASVVIVDASAECRSLVSTVLRSAGAQCYEAENGRQALDCLRWAGASLLITELDMPVMNGFDLISAIRAFPDGVKQPAIVICSDRLHDPSVYGRPEIAGVASLMFKPVTPLTLLRTVDAIIQRSRPGLSGAGGA